MVISTPFRVKNTGDLTLEYKIDVKCEYNKTDDGKSLEDVVQIKVVTLESIVGQGYDHPMTTDIDRSVLWSSATAIPASATLDAEKTKTSDAFVVMMYWQPNAEAFDNLYNNVKDAEGALLNIKCKIVVTAKQAASEADSVDSDYDKNATYPAAE